MGTGASDWKRLNVIKQLLTTADITTRNISSVHEHIKPNKTHYSTRNNTSKNICRLTGMLQMPFS